MATTAMAGAAAVAAGLAPPVGMVTARPPFDRVRLPDVGDLVFGGHDLVSTPLVKRAEQLSEAGVLPPALLPAVTTALDRADHEIRTGLVSPGVVRPRAPEPGLLRTPRRTPRQVIERASEEIVSFREWCRLDTVVVVNLSSTEAATGDCPPGLGAADLGVRLDDPEAAIPPSVLAVRAAFAAGCPFVDFTPSVATRMRATAELAAERRLPYAGRDGKTGETLVKTALAPMFAHRNLRVRSWAGTNLLGGSDGASLADPDRAASKLGSKRQALAQILGSEPAGPLHIDYVPDLGEWKTAWDHVGFEGFLGVRMSLQLTWQGCDSALAAPLVLDLARLVATAHRAGQWGPLEALGFFFKDPVGPVGPAGSAGPVGPTGPGRGAGAAVEHALERQHQNLCAWAATLPRRRPPEGEP